jgi:hypothetical protein
MPSVLNVDTIADAAGTGPVALTKQSAAKMWQGWVYSGSTPTSQGSFNVSSITDTTTGDAAFNLINAMSSTAGNSLVGGSNHATLGNALVDKDGASVFSQRLFDNAGGGVDAGGNFSIQVNGDLA